MGKRHICSDSNSSNIAKMKYSLREPNLEGECLDDLTGKHWKLGEQIGRGAFGQIYLVSDKSSVSSECPYVAKLEFHNSGPLFVEINFYLRVATKEKLLEWCKTSRKSIGLPHYIASGSVTRESQRYRFLILPRYGTDLGKMLEANANKFNVKTALSIGTQIIDTLEYIHGNGFIHGDIKASNILIQRPVVSSFKRRKKKGRPRAGIQLVNNVYLVDFGLASKYRLANGEHRSNMLDERRAHAGTILFCSRDAHKGIQTRRSDLESLGFNIIYWLTGSLPWIAFIDDYERVRDVKQASMNSLGGFLQVCFGHQRPSFLHNYFDYVSKLEYDDTPDYDYCRMLLQDGQLEYGYIGNARRNGCRQKPAHNCENIPLENGFVPMRNLGSPLKSNLALRNHKNRVIKWSQILMDPELILKSARMQERENEECSPVMDVLSNLNINKLNPTEAMLKVYSNYIKKLHFPEISAGNGKDCDSPKIDGYNATMMSVYTKMKKRNSIVKENTPRKSGRVVKGKKPSIAVRSSLPSALVRKYYTRSSK